MKKNFLQDVIPASQKRSIRDIPIPSHQKAKISIKKEAPLKSEEEIKDTYLPKSSNDTMSLNTFSKDEHSVFEPEQLQHATQNEDFKKEPAPKTYTPHESNIPTYKKNKKSYMKKIIIGVLIGIIIFFGFIFSRTEAIITIHSKKSTEDISLQIPLDSKNPQITQTQITKSLSKTLPATSEQQVEKQASGRIKIINTHKETPQELVKNTRFQTPNGLVYRIKDSIVVPGYTMSGSNVVPGTLEVEVYADSAGEEYNISKTKFTIPGFAGREQFDKITAETVGDMSGGYIGVRKVVTEDAKEKAQEELEMELKTQIEQTQNQSTEYVLVPDPTTLSYGELQDKAEGNSITLTLSASVDAYSFVKKDLFSFIGQNSIEGATTNDQFTLEGNSLTYLVEDKMVKMTGSTEVIWITDTEQLKKDFAGKKRSEVVTVIDAYRSFEKTDAELSPFWKTRFPSDPLKIEVVIAK